jgi:hypothetical protein
MANPLSFLKSRFFRPTQLAAGSLFTIDAPERSAHDEDYIWRVCKVQHFLGIPHALIEQPTTGKTKTVAVSALVGDRTFQFVQAPSA